MATSPAPQQWKRIPISEPMAEMIERYGREGGYVGRSEEESPWVPYTDYASIRHLAFDVRTNSYCNILWIKRPGIIGTHKHRGPVWCIVLEGSVRYLEYDWVAEAGDFFTEMPGAAHTLVTDNPTGMKALFWMQGANEFFDENGNHLETLDVFWFINHYESYCRANNLPINKALFL